MASRILLGLKRIGRIFRRFLTRCGKLLPSLLIFFKRFYQNVCILVWRFSSIPSKLLYLNSIDVIDATMRGINDMDATVYAQIQSEARTFDTSLTNPHPTPLPTPLIPFHRSGQLLALTPPKKSFHFARPPPPHVQDVQVVSRPPFRCSQETLDLIASWRVEPPCLRPKMSRMDLKLKLRASLWIPRPRRCSVLAIAAVDGSDVESSVDANLQDRCADDEATMVAPTVAATVAATVAVDQVVVPSEKKRPRRSRRGGRRRNKARGPSEQQVTDAIPPSRDGTRTETAIVADVDGKKGDGTGRKNRGRAYRRECRNRLKALRAGADPDGDNNGVSEKTWDVH